MKKKIIFVGYKFYGYEKEIVTELKKYYEVIYLDISLNLFERLLLKILGYKYLEKKFLLKIKDEVSVDIVLLLHSNKYNKEFITSLFNKIISLKKILYIWDDLNRVKNFQEIRNLFDEIYSFDKEDCKRENLKYRPTFYSERLKGLKKNPFIKYKYFFIGEYRRDRYQMLEKIMSKKTNYNNYFYFYCSFPMFIKKYFYDFLKNKNIYMKKINRDKYNEIFLQSEIIIDIPEKKQKGLTQRILDGIFLEKKIITTNEDIRFEKFYNSNNILIVKNFDEIDENFLVTPYVKIERKLIEYYSINNWIKDMLEGVE